MGHHPSHVAQRTPTNPDPSLRWMTQLPPKEPAARPAITAHADGAEANAKSQTNTCPTQSCKHGPAQWANNSLVCSSGQTLKQQRLDAQHQPLSSAIPRHNNNQKARTDADTAGLLRAGDHPDRSWAQFTHHGWAYVRLAEDRKHLGGLLRTPTGGKYQ